MSLSCRQEITEPCLPVLETFYPMYGIVPLRELEACHRAVREGADLSRVIKGKDERWVQMVYEASAEAERVVDRFLCLSAREMVAYPLEGLSDFTLAALHDVIMESDIEGETDPLTRRQNEMLVAILHSPTASPMVDYGWIFMDAVQYHVPDNLGLDPVEMLKRSLAHDLRHNQGDQSVSILQHMASVLIESDEPVRAIDIHTAILRRYPGRFDSYCDFALDLAKAGYRDAAVTVASRGLSVSRHQPAGHDAASDLEFHMGLWRSAADARESLPCQLQEKLEVALSGKSPSSPDNEQLIRELVPDLDELPVKASWRSPESSLAESPQSPFSKGE